MTPVEGGEEKLIPALSVRDYSAVTSSTEGASSRGVVRRDGARRPRVWFASRHSGGVGAPPVPNTRPCQELLTTVRSTTLGSRPQGPNAGPQRHSDLRQLQVKRGTDGESAARRC
jgi:hypothetical protein